MEGENIITETENGLWGRKEAIDGKKLEGKYRSRQ